MDFKYILCCLTNYNVYVSVVNVSAVNAIAVANTQSFSGDSSTSTLSLNEGTFTLTYTGGDQCAGDSTSHRETQVTILCDRQTPLGTPKYLNKDSESCDYHFEWEMAAACPPKELLCSAIGELPLAG